MERTPPEAVSNPPGVGAETGAMLEETEVAEGNGGEYYPGVSGGGTLRSTLRVVVPYRSGPGPTSRMRHGNEIFRDG